MNAPTKVVTRRATNVSLDEQVVAAAKELGINVSRACEDGLREEVNRVRQERWIGENRAAMEASNAWVEKHGLPLARFRIF